MNHNLIQLDQIDNNIILDAIKISYIDILNVEYIDFKVNMYEMINIMKLLIREYIINHDQNDICVRIKEFKKSILYNNLITKLIKENTQIKIKSIIIYTMLYLYSHTDEAKHHMILTKSYLLKYLDRYYHNFELSEDEIARYINFSNHLFVLKNLFTDRYINLYLDVLAKFEHPTEHIKYITGGGQKIIVTIRTKLIDKVFNYVKQKRSLLSNVNISVSNTKLNEFNYIDLNGDIKYCDIATLDSFSIDMSLFI